MSKRYLLCLLLLVQQIAHAQVYELAAVGLALGAGAFQKKPQDPNAYVTMLAYKGKSVSQKRTPPDKLKGKAAAEIARVEAALAVCSANLLADELRPICTDQQYFDLQLAIKRIPWAQKEWSVSAYDAENDFYRSENYWRTQRREQLAREVQQAQQVAQQARARHEQDSLFSIEQRQSFRADSISRLAQARKQAIADSLDEPRRKARAYELDMALLTPAGRRLVEASAKPKTHPAPKSVAKRPVARPSKSTGPSAYFCTSGNTVKYHSSSTCQGLTRCGASISRISLREAEQTMDPCKFCH